MTKRELQQQLDAAEEDAFWDKLVTDGILPAEHRDAMRAAIHARGRRFIPERIPLRQVAAAAQKEGE
jgi:hypothetical protein